MHLKHSLRVLMIHLRIFLENMVCKIKRKPKRKNMCHLKKMKLIKILEILRVYFNQMPMLKSKMLQIVDSVNGEAKIKMEKKMEIKKIKEIKMMMMDLETLIALVIFRKRKNKTIQIISRMLLMKPIAFVKKKSKTNSYKVEFNQLMTAHLQKPKMKKKIR